MHNKLCVNDEVLRMAYFEEFFFFFYVIAMGQTSCEVNCPSGLIK